MMQNILNKVRSLDLFAVPVSLTYKGKTRFSTLCGGFFSLIIILGFLAYSVMTLHELIVHPVLKSNAERVYFSASGNTDVFNITTKNATIAVAIAGST